ncbi:S8 family serine peptidase [Maribellus sediminis]|uniref:S8 family serine peptidase n=1 Tax=Maribellus sediminis TaxID=2696285 RepID=UPI001430A764|nr:S8 family serine peptidase [Maribellus sediminis]
MKRTLKLILYSVIMLGLISFNTSAQQINDGIVQGKLWIKLKPDSKENINITKSAGIVSTGIQAMNNLNISYNVTGMKRLFPYSAEFEGKHMKYGLHLWYELDVNASISATSMAEDYSGLEEVEIAEPVYIPVINDGSSNSVRSAGFSSESETVDFDDPYLVKQWHYNNTGQTGGTPGMDINLFKAWEITHGTPNVIVSIHDQGVDYRHEDLKNMMWINEAELNGELGVDDDKNGFLDDIYGFNFSGNTGDIDVMMHGTHVAGTIAAENNNGIGVCGVAGGTGNGDGVRVMTCQILGGVHEANIPLSYVYAADNGAVISQNSWGYQTPGYYNQAVHDAIDYFIEEAGDYPGSPMKGGIVIFAAGNSNTQQEMYPGAYSSCVSVAALDATGTRAPYSNYGEWVDIAAPGGDSDDDYTFEGDYSNGVLSTLDQNGYGYLDGTSMACPHVSGVAALVVSGYGGPDFTNEDLKAHILTGIKDIYMVEGNADEIGLLGAGLIDGELALANDNKIAPDKINDLSLAGISQDFATLSWTVPADEDDKLPIWVEVLYSKVEINESNLDYATTIKIKNTNVPGEKFDFEVDELQSVTKYYFAVRSVDRWGNVSNLSNIVTETTNNGPITSFSPEKNELEIVIDVTKDTLGSDNIKLINTGEGILKWDATPRHKEAVPLSNPPALRYPELAAANGVQTPTGIIKSFAFASPLMSNNIQLENSTEKGYVDFTQNLWIMGETNTNLPNSSATRFFVDEEDGFNLTQVDAYLNHDESTGPVILEIYEGNEINNAKLLLAQEVAETASGNFTNIPLDEQLFFENGKYFWIVIHVPAGNKYPLGAGAELHEEDSKNCYMSLNGGKTWSSFEELYYDNQVVWAVFAMSQNLKLDEYVILSPTYGNVASGKDTTIVATVSGTNMINGEYKANLVVYTNETDNPVMRMPVNITVTGHKPEIFSANRVNFGNLLVGTSKTIDVKFDNKGLGRFKFKAPDVQLDNPQFSLVNGVSQNFEAKTSQVLRFRFDAAKVGNNVCKVTLLEENGNDYSFELFASGLEPPVVALNPNSVTYDNLSIGDTINGQVWIKNEGNYPLDYYMPVFADGSNMENIPEDIQKFGYSVEIDTTGNTFVWNDIAATGSDITSMYLGNIDNNIEQKFPIDFIFPFYGKYENDVYITKYGVLEFTPNKYMNATSPLAYHYEGNPDRYISGCGFPMLFEEAGFGKIYYKNEPDKFIVQFEDAPFWDGIAYEDPYGNNSKEIRVSVTFQMVLYDNGNIDLFYKDCTIPDWIGKQYTLIAMEDRTMEDGILIQGNKYKDWGNTVGDFTYKPGSAIHIKNPGLGLFSNVTNPFGTVMAHDSVQVAYSITTDSLSAIPYNENLVVITNDPQTNPAIHTVNFNITNGGKSIVSVDTLNLDFGTFFKGTISGKTIVVSNSGTAIDSITSAVFDHDYFTLSGNVPCMLKPERKAPLVIKAKSETVGEFSDTLRITTLNGQVFKVALHSEIILGPVFELLNASGSSALKSVTKFMNAGDNTDVGFKINNPGSADLKVAPFNNEWTSITENVQSELTDSVMYMVQKSNLSSGVQYEWIDVFGNGGSKIEGIDTWYGPNWSEGLEMPFSFNFYGVEYDTLYIGNGLVTFTKDQNDHFYFWGGGAIPDTTQPNNYIAPLWLFGGPDWVTIYPNAGIYYRFDEDKVVVEYHEYNSNFVMGPPISFEVILYPNGNIKFQYKMPEGGDNTVTNQGTIGIENASGTDGVMVSDFQYVVNSDMAIGLYPARSYTIPAGESKDFNLHLDTKYLVEGSYSDSIHFVNNDPFSLLHKLPVKMVVSGEPAIEIPELLEFGDLIINPETPDISKVFEIKNTGTANYTLSGLSHQDEDSQIEIYMKNGDTWEWTDMASTSFPVTVLARSSRKIRVTLHPETPESIRDTIILSTSLTPASYRVAVNADIFNPSVISMTTDTITCFAQTDDFSASKERQFGNETGGYKLDYSVKLLYQREGIETSDAATGTSNQKTVAMSGMGDSLVIAPVAAGTMTVNAGQLSLDVEYNRILSHDTITDSQNRLGYNGGRAFFTATGFVAPPDGFNLTHIQNWFVPGEWLNSKIQVMVLAGDDDINNCVVLTSETFEHNVPADDEAGSLLTYKLSDSIQIYPGEKFFVAFGYEAALTHPQGCVYPDQDIPHNRYMFGSGYAWDDLANYSQFARTGWMMRAVEATQNDTPWVVLKSEFEGTLEPGQTGSMQMDFTARTAEYRDNYATLLLNSNDIVNPLKKVVLHLIKNSGPLISAPADLSVNETDTLRFDVIITDQEGDDFSVELDQPYDFLSIENTQETSGQDNAKSKILSFVYTPDYNSQGIHQFGITTTDAYQKTTTSTVVLKVNNVNRWPEAIATDTVKLESYGNYRIFNLEDLFYDSDNDIEILEGSSSNTEILNLYSSDNSFLLMPGESGETSITFLATDKYGAQATNTVQILVGKKFTSVDPDLEDMKFGVYPNPTQGDIFITLPSEIEGEAILYLFDSNGRMLQQKNFYEGGSTLVSFDLTAYPNGFYFVKLICKNEVWGNKIIKQ